MREYKKIYEGQPPFFASLFPEEIPPRRESLKDMICFTYCPFFSYGSLTFIWMILDTFIYICCFWLNGITKAQQLLKTSQKSLYYLGELYPYYARKQYHLYRFLTALLLFRNFYHFLLAIVSILGFSSYIENLIGWKKTFLLIIFSGIAGELFGIIFQKHASIEGSTPICGLFGYLLGILLLSWKKWGEYGNQRFHMLLMLIFMCLLYFYNSFLYRNINLYSQIGAILYGFIFSFWQNEQVNEFRCSQFFKIASFILLFLILLFLFLNFFLWKKLYVIEI